MPSVEEWARFALTGDPDAAAPTDGQLAMVKGAVVRELAQANPCIGSNPEATLTGDDLEAWHEWAGYMVAMRYIGTPAGRQIAQASGGTVREKSGRVETSRTEMKSTDAQLEYRMAGNSARSRVSCIRAQIVAANNEFPGMATLVGPRRATREPETIREYTVAGTPGEDW